MKRHVRELDEDTYDKLLLEFLKDAKRRNRMGDIADYLIEQGETDYFMHLADKCDSDCQYCEEDATNAYANQKCTECGGILHAAWCNFCA